MSKRTDELIDRLGLQRHPERGYYAETYRATLGVDAAPHGGRRPASTAIYFLITGEEPSTYLHRLLSDEVFHLYEGGPLDVLFLKDGEAPAIHRLGRDISGGERPQLVIPAGTWFGAELTQGAPYCLIGCTVAPGFEFQDFELAEGPELARRFPRAADRIARMLRPAASIGP
jgi:predicted cupin superfamily sugar epimerase